MMYDLIRCPCMIYFFFNSTIKTEKDRANINTIIAEKKYTTLDPVFTKTRISNNALKKQIATKKDFKNNIMI